MTFSDLGLSLDVLKAVEDAGYTQPTPIQEKAIPTVLMGRDILGCAQTGTGKTASFCLPMIDILTAGRAKARMPRSLIVEPTRELAAQVLENFDTYGKYHRLTTALIIGGESFSEQEKALDRGVDVLIATPGRLLDLFERGRILLNDVKILVIDEADRMLDMGFIPDIERIVSVIPKIRQTLFFSATMPPEIRRLADAFLMNPKEISVAPPATPAETVAQALAIMDERDKPDALRRLIESEGVKNAVIFCNRKRDVDLLYKALKREGCSVAALHGDLPQSARTATLDSFKRNEITLLVASDVAARGLDIEDLSHVFNYDTPIHAEDYIHRIGRTGRAGRSGKAFMLATPDDGKFIEAIARLVGKEIPRIDIPGIQTLELGEGGGRRGRGRTRGAEKSDKSPKGRERDKPRASDREKPREPEAETPAAAPVELVQQPVREPAREIPRERPERPARGERKPRPEPSVRPVVERERPRADASRYRRRDEGDDAVAVGFADHVPAFILRTVRIAEPKPGDIDMEPAYDYDGDEAEAGE